MLLPHDEAGSGPAVVLLHAGVADRTMWAEHLPPLADAGHRAIAMDLPGFGQAPPTSEARPWSDVLETMDALDIQRAALVGNSFGGAVALNVAAVAPERATALVLVSAPRPGWSRRLSSRPHGRPRSRHWSTVTSRRPSVQWSTPGPFPRRPKRSVTEWGACSGAPSSFRRRRATRPRSRNPSRRTRTAR